MRHDKKDKAPAGKKTKPIRYYRDGEVLEERVPPHGGAPQRDRRTVMMLCPESLLREIDHVCDFNYLERSEFFTMSAQLLLDYMDARNLRELDDLAAPEPANAEAADGILMSKERYPYEEGGDDADQ